MMGSLHNSILNRMRMHRNVALDRSETNAPSSCIRKDQICDNQSPVSNLNRKVTSNHPTHRSIVNAHFSRIPVQVRREIRLVVWAAWVSNLDTIKYCVWRVALTLPLFLSHYLTTRYCGSTMVSWQFERKMLNAAAVRIDCGSSSSFIYERETTENHNNKFTCNTQIYTRKCIQHIHRHTIYSYHNRFYAARGVAVRFRIASISNAQWSH